MKKIFATAAFLAFIAIGAPAMAQEDTTNIAKKAWKGTKKGAKKAWKGTKKAGKAVGNKTAETASRVGANVADTKSDEWIGPNGEAIYVKDVNNFYWIDDKGKHHAIAKSKLKAKS